jgi:hypothetical protein
VHQVITEAASEKRKRGRPPVILPGLSEQVVSMFAPDVKTRRAKLDAYYRIHALAVLKDVPEATWLCDMEAMKAGKSKSWKPAILTELGRIEDVEALRHMAKLVCDAKPSTKEAVAWLRRWRTGKSAPTSEKDLFRTLARTFDDYKRTHPDLDERTAVDAINSLYCAVQDLYEEPGGDQ